MHRSVERRLDPSRQQSGYVVECKRQGRPFYEEPVATETDQIDGGDEMLARQRVDVAAPPVRGAAQAVDQNDRSPTPGSRFPEAVRR
jgi:hypothetical protein